MNHGLNQYREVGIDLIIDHMKRRVKKDHINYKSKKWMNILIQFN